MSRGNYTYGMLCITMLLTFWFFPDGVGLCEIVPLISPLRMEKDGTVYPHLHLFHLGLASTSLLAEQPSVLGGTTSQLPTATHSSIFLTTGPGYFCGFHATL